jgi:hypothetical protein
LTLALLKLASSSGRGHDLKEREILVEIVFPFGISLIKFYRQLAEQALESLKELESLSQKIVFDEANRKAPLEIAVSIDPPRKFKRFWATHYKSFAWE